MSIASNQGLVKKICRMRITALYPSASGIEHKSCLIRIVRHQVRRLPGKGRSLITVMVPGFRVGAVACGTLDFIGAGNQELCGWVCGSQRDREGACERAFANVPVWFD